MEFIINFIFITESKNCKTCDRILSALETRNVELEEAGIKLVKLNDKKAAKTHGVLSSPGLTYFKGKLNMFQFQFDICMIDITSSKTFMLNIYKLKNIYFELV